MLILDSQSSSHLVSRLMFCLHSCSFSKRFFLLFFRGNKGTIRWLHFWGRCPATSGCLWSFHHPRWENIRSCEILCWPFCKDSNRPGLNFVLIGQKKPFMQPRLETAQFSSDKLVKCFKVHLWNRPKDRTFNYFFWIFQPFANSLIVSLSNGTFCIFICS